MKRDFHQELETNLGTAMLEVYRLRDEARRRMYRLQAKYNAEFRDAYLRLRPWARRRGSPPYSLCWVRIFTGSYRLDHKTLWARHRPNPWPFRRLAVHRNRDLDTIIHRCQLDAHRARIFEFHRVAQDLNQAAHACSRAIDVFRKHLSGRAASGSEWCGGQFLRSYGPKDRQRLRDRLRQFTFTVGKEIDALRQVAQDYCAAPWCADLDLVFVQDLGFPFGRLLWVDQRSGLECARLGSRLRRQLGLDAGHRALVTYVERTMTRMSRLLLRRHTTFQKLLRGFETAKSVAQPIVERIDLPLIKEEWWNRRSIHSSDLGPPPWELRTGND